MGGSVRFRNFRGELKESSTSPPSTFTHTVALVASTFLLPARMEDSADLYADVRVHTATATSKYLHENVALAGRVPGRVDV